MIKTKNFWVPLLAKYCNCDQLLNNTKTKLLILQNQYWESKTNFSAHCIMIKDIKVD